MAFEPISKWQGGKPGGTLINNINKGIITVRFTNPNMARSFNYTLETKVKAENEAKTFRYYESEKRGLTKNRYRYVKDIHGKECIEFELQNNMYGYCDINDINIVTQCVWTAKKSNDKYYIGHSKNISNPRAEKFHNLLFPEYASVDHINRDGLDNRRINLRESNSTINEKNQKKRIDNKTGKTGVHFDINSNRYIVQWVDETGRKKKSFSTNKYGINVARELAIKFRQEMDQITDTYNGYIVNDITNDGTVILEIDEPDNATNIDDAS
jgi:hypothetical protein